MQNVTYFVRWLEKIKKKKIRLELFLIKSVNVVTFHIRMVSIECSSNKYENIFDLVFILLKRSLVTALNVGTKFLL